MKKIIKKMDSNHELLTITLVGHSEVGKTSIKVRFTNNLFEDPFPTIGMDISQKKYKFEETNLVIREWTQLVKRNIDRWSRLTIKMLKE